MTDDDDDDVDVDDCDEDDVQQRFVTSLAEARSEGNAAGFEASMS